ncbi:MAG: GTP cyclohydrolase II [Saprospiraceae bacterium]
MKKQAAAVIPTDWGNFNMMAYADTSVEQMPHLAIVHEDFDPTTPTLVRIHSECMTGDVFTSHRCDCGEQLARAFELTAEVGGAIIYLRQEGRGIGLINKLKAYNLQDEGLDTVEANVHLGHEVDARQYDIAIEIMQDLGMQQIRLLTNNPLKVKALEYSEIDILSREPIVIPAKKENKSYLRTKREILGHLLS